MRRFHSYLLVIPILLSTFSCKEDKQEMKTASAQLDKTLVGAVVAERETLSEDINVTGNILPNESVELISEAPGIIKKIHFEEGQEVKKGKLLLELENADMYAELSGVEAQIALVENKLSRAKGLFEAKGISKESLDEIQTDLEKLDAQKKNILANISKSKIYAPFDGIIGLRNVSDGEYVSVNDYVARLVDITPLKIEFSLPEKYMNNLKEGDEIHFTTASFPNEFTAKVYAIEPMLDPASRTITARAEFANKDKKLLPGGYAEVTYSLNTYENSIAVPNQAIIPEMDGKKILLIENGKVVEKEVTTGIRMADYIQVVRGVDPGDSIITMGMLQVEQGDAVRVKIDQSVGSKTEINSSL